MLAADELERDRAPWKVERQDKNCPRRAAEILGRVHTLLRHSRELVLVDRFFDPSEPRFARPFEALVGVRSDWKRLELHTARPDPFRPEVQEANYRRALELAIPGGVTLAVCFWPGLPGGEQIHPRFVLTGRGGVQFDHGLDECGSAAGSTLVTLLEHEVFLGYRRDYAVSSGAFGTPDVVKVVGRG